MNRLWSAFKNLSLPTQVGVIGAVVVVLMMIVGGTNRLTSYLERRAFTKELQAEKELRQKDIERADAAEARAVAAESEKTKFEIAFAVAGRDAEKALEKVENASKEFDKEIINIDAPADIVERCLRLCAKFKLKPEQCGCTKDGSGN